MDREEGQMTAMDLGMTERLKPIHAEVARMVREEIKPLDDEFLAEVGKNGNRWEHTPRQTEILEGLKAKARERNLWNFWLTDSERGYGLTTVEYAYLAEEMGKAHLGPEVFNCAAPDTGNMEVFERYGTEEHKRRWLDPLLEGKIRSAYLMTEPDVASSDATNISMRCERDGDDYVLNGEKWWSSGAGDPRCQIYIVMVKTGTDEDPKHARHSMILVPANTPGITKLRAMEIYGHDDAPHGHLHMRFENVRVPALNLLLGEGRGFEIAQGRLGPGRIHHCMRAIGQAEAALELMCQRAMRREAFGQPLAKLGANYDIIAESRMEIEMARLLCLKAAWMMDQGDARAAAPWISQIKVVAPRVALKVTDEAVQMFGGEGVSQDTPLARMWTHLRTLRFADGPDAVHRRQVARTELKRYTQEKV
jgi:acyl-CoA dehydrogenase